jgi:hypothetical protein
MARKPTVTDNTLVSSWMIDYKWLKPVSNSTLLRIPAFVDDAIFAALYTVSGVSGGKLNVSPKLVKKALMLKEISSESVKGLEFGYEMSDRQAQRLAKTVRYAILRIESQIDAYQEAYTIARKQEIQMERNFVKAYRQGTESELYSHTQPAPPAWITALYTEGKYLEYGVALQEFRSN